jgi:hypothetical protein
VELIDQQVRLIRVRPHEYPGRGWACWWYFQLAGVEPGETITLEVGPAPWATPLRAVFTTDNQQWQQIGPGHRRNGWIVYRQRIDSEAAWFVWGPPFTLEHAQRHVHLAASKADRWNAFELCETRAGHRVPALFLPAEITSKQSIWIQARQHAWESGSSWVCAGIIDWVVSDDPRARRLRRETDITVVPVMDVDSVVLGAGGKNQAPNDHNRDWGPDPHWPAVAAAMERLRQMNRDGRLVLFTDLHNPGPADQSPYFYVTPCTLLAEVAQRNLDRFLASVREEMTGPLSFRGETRESGPQYDPNWEKISKNWVSRHTAPHVVAVTLETAWNTERSTITGYQTVGRQLGKAIERFLRLDPKQE